VSPAASNSSNFAMGLRRTEKKMTTSIPLTMSDIHHYVSHHKNDSERSYKIKHEHDPDDVRRSDSSEHT
jgi:hypothetical protein